MTFEIWLLIVAVIYTYFGYVWGRRNGAQAGIEVTVDNLIRDGYLFVKKTPMGEDELVKINDIINQKSIITDNNFYK